MGRSSIFLAAVLLGATSCGGDAPLRSAVSEDAADTGWISTSVYSEPMVNPPSGAGWVGIVQWSESYGDDSQVTGVSVFDDCDDECTDAASAFASTAVDDRSLARVLSGDCGNCGTEDFVGVITDNPAGVRSVSLSDLPEVLGPIDTAYEAMLVAGRAGLVRASGDGWELVWSTMQICTDDDITHTLLEVSAAGVIQEIDSFVEPPEDVESVACQ